MTNQFSGQEIDPKAMSNMSAIVTTIVNGICFEAVAEMQNGTNGQAMANINEMAATISQAVFEREFGSTLASALTVGKAKTEARINGSNKVARMFFDVAFMVVERMTAAQIVEAAEQVAAQA